ncbi:MAG: cca [Chlamydiia bacterium]|nr:cca [Chlamydiia bacterium]
MDALKCAQEICEALRNAGYIAYFAGGWVRDFLLGITSSDIDIATDALPEEIVKLFPHHVLIGAQFGVVLVLYGNYQFEVASFRQDMHYIDGRKPTQVLLKSTPKEDAFRRDFTINGMFFNPETQEIYDFIGGKEDLKKKIIRTIGKPEERFQEDRLRMLRAVRFAYRFGFTIDEATKKAISLLSGSLLPAVSIERVYQEFCKMREGQNFKEALLELQHLHLLEAIFPSLQGISSEAMEERLYGIEKLSTRVPTILFLIQLFDTSETKFIETLHLYLRSSKEDGKWIETYLKLKQRSLKSYDRYELSHLLSDHHFEIAFEVLTAKMTLEESMEWHNWYIQTLHDLAFFVHLIRKKEPLIKAADLQALGIPPGKEMGRLLEKAERLSINLNLKEKEKILEKLREHDLKP